MSGPPTATDDAAISTATTTTITTTTTTTDSTMAAPAQTATNPPKPGPGSGAAFFSTERCTRAPRSQGPFPPVLVRSDKIAGVVDAAKLLQKEFKAECLCIFPGQGWAVEDLWDAEDIHLETRPFCHEMLTFIERDTYYAALDFAAAWSRQYPDRVDFAQEDMGDIKDANNDLGIVDKVFVVGETDVYPRTFLWHVANLMLIARTEAGRVSTAALAMDGEQEAASKKAAPAKTEAPAAATASSTHTNAPTDPGRSKTNCKSTPSPSRPYQLTASTEPSSTVATSTRSPFMPPAALHPSGTRTGFQRVPSYGPLQPGGYHTQQNGSNIMSPNMHPQAMNFQRGNRNTGSGSHGQPMPPHGWAENVTRRLSGPYPRARPGPMSNIQSPQFMPATMAMGQHVMVPIIPPAMQPHFQGPPLMPPAGYTVQHIDHPMPPHGGVPYHPGPMHQDPRGMLIGDMTNNMQYQNNMAPHHALPPAPTPRRGSSGLYNPYEGTKRKFNDTAPHNGGKKGGPSSFMNQPDRPRKNSTSGGRSAYNNSTADRIANMPHKGASHTDFNSRRRVSEDDPKITQDSKAGCNREWIGPDNSTVTELWIGDLPLDAQPVDIVRLFQQGVNISPTDASIKGPYGFAVFASTSDARTALALGKHNPRLRDGLVPVTVTVPRRYYQKETAPSMRRESFNSGLNFGQTHTNHAGDRSTRGGPRMSSHDEQSAITRVDAAAARPKASYSPQDARSDLHKKSARQSESGHPHFTGSPESQKSKRPQSSPTKQAKLTRGAPIEKVSTKAEATEVSGQADASGSTLVVAEVKMAINNAPVSEESITDAAEPAVSTTSDSATTADKISATLEDTVSVIGEVADVLDHASSKPLEHQEVPKISHDDEKPRTKSNVELSPDNRASAVDNLPKAEDAVPLAEPAITEAKNAKDKPSDVSMLDSTPHPADEPVSDDEAKNEISFHSAQEVQTEFAQVELQSEPQNELIANQGTTTSTLSCTEKAPQPTDTFSPSVTSEEIKQEESQAPLTQSEQQVTATSTPEATSQDIQEDKAVHAQDLTAMPPEKVVVAPAPDGEAMTTSTEASPVEAKKRHGAQQMQSLHPFAKPNKRKEKEAKKKQQKKDEKAMAFTKPDGGTAVQAKTEQPKASGDTPADAETPVKPAKEATASQTAQSSKKFKGRTKVATACTADQEKLVEIKDEQSGKPNGDSASKVPKEIDSVTHKADVAETSKLKPTPQVCSTASGACADIPEVKASDPSSPPGPGLSPHVPATPHDVRALPKKQMKPVPAVPHLDLPFRPSTHNQGSQLNSISSPTHSSTTNMPQPPKQDVSLNESSSRRSSAASSDTLNPEDEDHRSPDFNTPTPSEDDAAGADTTQVDASQNETPKKKKKKNKKNKSKNNKNSAADAEPVDAAKATLPSKVARFTADFGFYDPFASQMSHIDAIRRAHKYDTTSYFARTNKKMAEEKEKAKEAAKSEEATKADKAQKAKLSSSLDTFQREFGTKASDGGKKLTQEDLNLLF
ncbi:hypothetical protein EJ02DRAFT_420609 [Clathrospora elynae]|uniref:RRM domain-containing protein n=1 Tax=Clathrospora elynae TaxID=706981 RepID=A0A6A5SVN6_9PLEO|nr:hypothetical protein EJ02DRAFT_420609 [Clathrospora elynae]